MTLVPAVHRRQEDIGIQQELHLFVERGPDHVRRQQRGIRDSSDHDPARGEIDLPAGAFGCFGTVGLADGVGNKKGQGGRAPAASAGGYHAQGIRDIGRQIESSSHVLWLYALTFRSQAGGDQC
jgi:hypothetical protein